MRERDRMIQILFLEDEPTIREVLAEYMKIQGYEVTEAGDGDEGSGPVGSFHNSSSFLMIKKIVTFRN